MPETYDKIVTALRNDDATVKTYSLRGDCVLNELSTFHATTSFAPDLMHDFLGNCYLYILKVKLKLPYL
jgi:hypothetical protein